MLMNVGSGGGAAAAPAAGGAGAAAGGAAEEAPKEAEKEEGELKYEYGKRHGLLTALRVNREGRVRRGYGFRSVRLSVPRHLETRRQGKEEERCRWLLNAAFQLADCYDSFTSMLATFPAVSFPLCVPATALPLKDP